MEDLSFIRDLFRPLQPTVTSSGELVVYREKAPDISLSSLVYCYWKLESTQELKSGFSYRVVSDGCVDILWECDSSQKIFITGFSSQYTEFPLASSFRYIGVRFFPAAIPLLFNTPAETLTNEFLHLEDIIPQLSKSLHEIATNTCQLDEISPLLDSMIISVLSKVKLDVDPRFFNAFHRILKSQGTISLSEVDTGISQRQLRRMFKFY